MELGAMCGSTVPIQARRRAGRADEVLVLILESPNRRLGQAPLAGTRAFLQNLRVNPLSGVTDRQTEQIRAV
jgi:hypothetical protein